MDETTPDYPEGKSIDDYIQYIDDMTLEEFIEVYNLEDITDEVMKYM